MGSTATELNRTVSLQDCDTVTDDVRLTEIMNASAQRFGFGSAMASFRPDSGLKITWFRTDESIRFSVPDSLSGCPAWVIEDISDSLASAMAGSRIDMSDKCKRYLNENRGTHLKLEGE